MKTWLNRARKSTGLRPQKEAPDSLCYSSIVVLLGLTNCDDDESKMLVIETAQLLATDPRFETIDWDAKPTENIESKALLDSKLHVPMLIQNKNMSVTLRKRLDERWKGL